MKKSGLFFFLFSHISVKASIFNYFRLLFTSENTTEVWFLSRISSLYTQNNTANPCLPIIKPRLVNANNDFAAFFIAV